MGSELREEVNVGDERVGIDEVLVKGFAVGARDLTIDGALV